MKKVLAPQNEFGVPNKTPMVFLCGGWAFLTLAVFAAFEARDLLAWLVVVACVVSAALFFWFSRWLRRWNEDHQSHQLRRGRREKRRRPNLLRLIQSGGEGCYRELGARTVLLWALATAVALILFSLMADMTAVQWGRTPLFGWRLVRWCAALSLLPTALLLSFTSRCGVYESRGGYRFSDYG